MTGEVLALSASLAIFVFALVAILAGWTQPKGGR